MVFCVGSRALTGMISPVRAVLEGLPAGISDFRLPVVNNDKLWKNDRQYWRSWPDPRCQLSVPGGGPFSLLACLTALLSAFNLLLMCLSFCSS